MWPTPSCHCEGALATAAIQCFPVRIKVLFHCYTADGKNVDQQYGRIKLKDNQQWQEVSVIMPLSPETVRISALLRVYGKGAVLFDDVSLETSGISVTPDRKMIPANSTENIHYELKLYHPWKEKELPVINADLSSKDIAASKKQIQTTVQRGKDNQHFQVTVPVAPLKAGDYQLNFSLQQEGKQITTQFPAEIYTSMPNRKPQYLTDNGTILLDGKPFFPIGIYHVAHTDAGYQLLKNNGFNAIQGVHGNDSDALKVSLDRAQKYGIAVDVPLYWGHQVAKNLPSSLDKIRRFAEHPAVLDWKIIDEPEFFRSVAGEIPSVYRALKTADKNHPIELTLSASADTELWSNFSDVIQRDVYPFPNRPLTQITDVAKATAQMKHPWQNLSFVLQCGWTPDLKNQPSAAQARSMVYLALIEGAKGIWWYSMHDPKWDLTKTPLWPHMKTINAEIKELSMPLMVGEMVKGISSNNSKVLFTARKYQNKLYILLTNPHEEQASVTLHIPENQLLKKSKHQVTLSLDGFGSQTLALE